MLTSIKEILTVPHTEALPPHWVEPSLIIFDDLLGPTALQIIEKQANAKPAQPDRLAVVSKIDRETALPDRVRADDRLQAFAKKYSLPFTRLDSTCDNEFTLPAALRAEPNIIAAPAILPATIGAQGGLAVVINAEDLAHAFSTGQVWYRRPPLQTIELRGTLPPTRPPAATLHDLAILLRPQIKPGALLVITQTSAPESETNHPRFNETIIALLNDSTASAALCNPIPDSDLTADLSIQLDNLQPMIGCGASAARALSDWPRTTFHRAYIGSCRTGSVDDLRLAAGVLHQQKVTIPTIISPASTADAALLRTERLNSDDSNSPILAEIFIAAGCDIGLPGCSACVNAIADLSTNNHPSPRGDDPLNIIATAVAGVTARATANILTASPTTAAQVAVTGQLH